MYVELTVCGSAFARTIAYPWLSRKPLSSGETGYRQLSTIALIVGLSMRVGDIISVSSLVFFLGGGREVGGRG